MALAYGGANNIHQLSWGGGGAQTEKILVNWIIPITKLRKLADSAKCKRSVSASKGRRGEGGLKLSKKSSMILLFIC